MQTGVVHDDATPELAALAELLVQRNRIDQQIARLLGRPVSAGAIGEWIAARVFDIRLEDAANTPGLDGRFASGPLAGESVNIKLYGKRDTLDITPTRLPDYYLALTGPKGNAASTRGTHAAVVIDGVYLFDAHELVSRLLQRDVQVGIATSVRVGDWETAQVFPSANGRLLMLTDGQREMLRLFAG